jgi:single-strand DNA-binding protein
LKKVLVKINLKVENMNTLRNKVTLIGNLGNDPEIKSFDGNKKMVKLSVATNEYYKNNKGERVNETQWHNIIAWGKLAEISERYLKKGAELAVEGKISTRSYNDKEGNKRYTTEIIASDILLLGGK